MTIAAEIVALKEDLALVKKFFEGTKSENVTPDLPTIAKARSTNFNKGTNNTGISLSLDNLSPFVTANSGDVPDIGPGAHVITGVWVTTENGRSGYYFYYRDIIGP